MLSFPVGWDIIALLLFLGRDVIALSFPVSWDIITLSFNYQLGYHSWILDLGTLI